MRGWSNEFFPRNNTYSIGPGAQGYIGEALGRVAVNCPVAQTCETHCETFLKIDIPISLNIHRS